MLRHMQMSYPHASVSSASHHGSHRSSCLKFARRDSDMQMRRDIRIQKARARWQRVNQSINAGYSRSNTSSLCSLTSALSGADHTCLSDMSGIRKKRRCLADSLGGSGRALS